MGYATRYSLKITNLMESEEYKSVSIDNLIKGVKKDSMSKDEVISQLQMIKRGVDMVTSDYIMEQLRDENESANYAFDSEGDAEDECKWYEHEEELKEFSKKYPTWLFTLEGIGEESPDLWRKYILNGKSQLEKAQITYGEFDINKLKK